MIKIMGHAGYHRRVAINVGAGFVRDEFRADGCGFGGGKLGWELVGIRTVLKGCCTRSVIQMGD